MNNVIEARMAAEANLITRREETAALRSQAKTATLLAENPTLMLEEAKLNEQDRSEIRRLLDTHRPEAGSRKKEARS
jgi:hypothetical protein